LFAEAIKSIALSCVAICLTLNPALANGLIRDAEIERTLQSAARPLLQKAGLPVSSTNILIVNDRSMNAFVAGGNNIFINAGLVMRLKSVEMLQAVIAHEIGHITGGHVSQRAAARASANSATGIGIILGLITAAAGGAQAGAAVVFGSTDAVRKSVLSNTRSQEASADQSGARYMAAAGIDPAAAIEVLDLFRGQELLSVRNIDPYAQTHPLSSERISRLRGYVAAYRPKESAQAPDIDYWYARAAAKFRGFLDTPKSTLKRYPASDDSEPALLARAIAYHRLPDPAKASATIDRLIGMRPGDAFYHELKGQFLLESGKAAPAVTSYRKAADLAPDESLIHSGLGRALLATDTAANNKAALAILKKSYSRDSRDDITLYNLALAFARDGQAGMASVITAERYALASDFKQATIHAERAKQVLPQGTSGWLRADDIVIAAKRINDGK
jgi:predicted Zn-dependent protease